MDTHPGLAPGKGRFASVRLVYFGLCVIKVGRPTGFAPARRLSQSRMLTFTL